MVCKLPSSAYPSCLGHKAQSSAQLGRQEFCVEMEVVGHSPRSLYVCVCVSMEEETRTKGGSGILPDRQLFFLLLASPTPAHHHHVTISPDAWAQPSILGELESREMWASGNKSHCSVCDTEEGLWEGILYVPEYKAIHSLFPMRKFKKFLAQYSNLNI